MPAMLALIFVLTLAIRSIALVIGAVASVEKAAVDGRLKAVSCSAVAFPCHFPARHLAGKIFSLLARLGKLAQRLDLTGEYPAERADFGAHRGLECPPNPEDPVHRVADFAKRSDPNRVFPRSRSSPTPTTRWRCSSRCWRRAPARDTPTSISCSASPG